MVQALDAGPSLLQMRTPIPPDETYGELQLRLAERGALALVEVLALISLGRAVETPQDDALATYAPKIDRAMTRVDWSADAAAVARAIRAYDPRPGAFAETERGPVKLFGGRVASESITARIEPGAVLAIEADGMLVACGDGAVRVAIVQPAGKRRLTPREWASGRGIAVGERLF
jgi:methionyl-tRNA formyltransferase